MKAAGEPARLSAPRPGVDDRPAVAALAIVEVHAVAVPDRAPGAPQSPQVRRGWDTPNDNTASDSAGVNAADLGRTALWG